MKKTAILFVLLFLHGCTTTTVNENNSSKEKIKTYFRCSDNSGASKEFLITTDFQLSNNTIEGLKTNLEDKYFYERNACRQIGSNQKTA